ncbi:hypothetical protein WJX74_007886 [Apatococcus lobatus]|uniref:Uncharacterized protein n=1 Tax=Apatococcus lobatus TaxID=904363 RepID=A0AAW1Q653_9CHLO
MPIGLNPSHRHKGQVTATFVRRELHFLNTWTVRGPAKLEADSKVPRRDDCEVRLPTAADQHRCLDRLDLEDGPASSAFRSGRKSDRHLLLLGSAEVKYNFQMETAMKLVVPATFRTSLQCREPAQLAQLQIHIGNDTISDSELARTMQEEEYALEPAASPVYAHGHTCMPRPLEPAQAMAGPPQASLLASRSQSSGGKHSSQGPLQQPKIGHQTLDPQLGAGTLDLAPQSVYGEYVLTSLSTTPASQTAHPKDIPVNLAAGYCKPASRELDEQLHLLGFVRLPTWANGGCFLSAIAFSARQDFMSAAHGSACFPTMSELHFWGQEVRQTTVAYIRQWAIDNPQEALSYFVQGIIQDPDYKHLSSFDDWLVGQSGPNSYTDETFMDFAALCLGCQIVSMWSSNGWWRVYPRDARLRSWLPPTTIRVIPVIFIEPPQSGDAGHFEILATSASSYKNALGFEDIDFSNDHHQLATRQAASSSNQQATGLSRDQEPMHSSPPDKALDGDSAVHMHEAQATLSPGSQPSLADGGGQATCPTTGTADLKKLGCSDASEAQSFQAIDSQVDGQTARDKATEAKLSGGHLAEVVSRKRSVGSADAQPSPRPTKRGQHSQQPVPPLLWTAQSPSTSRPDHKTSATVIDLCESDDTCMTKLQWLEADSGASSEHAACHSPPAAPKTPQGGRGSSIGKAQSSPSGRADVHSQQGQKQAASGSPQTPEHQTQDVNGQQQQQQQQQARLRWGAKGRRRHPSHKQHSAIQGKQKKARCARVILDSDDESSDPSWSPSTGQTGPAGLFGRSDSEDSSDDEPIETMVRRHQACATLRHSTPDDAISSGQEHALSAGGKHATGPPANGHADNELARRSGPPTTTGTDPYDSLLMLLSHNIWKQVAAPSKDAAATTKAPPSRQGPTNSPPIAAASSSCVLAAAALSALEADGGHARNSDPSVAFPGFVVPACGVSPTPPNLNRMNTAQPLTGLPSGDAPMTPTSIGNGLPKAQSPFSGASGASSIDNQQPARQRCHQMPDPVNEKPCAAHALATSPSDSQVIENDQHGAFGSPLEASGPPTPDQQCPDKFQALSACAPQLHQRPTGSSIPRLLMDNLRTAQCSSMKAQAEPSQVPRQDQVKAGPPAEPSSDKPPLADSGTTQRRRLPLAFIRRRHDAAASQVASAQLEVAKQELQQLQGALKSSEARREQDAAHLASMIQEIHLLREKATVQQAAISDHTLCAEHARKVSALNEQQAAAELELKNKQLEQLKSDVARQNETSQREIERLAAELRDSESRLQQVSAQHAAAMADISQLQQVLQDKNCKLHQSSAQFAAKMEMVQQLKLDAVVHKNAAVLLKSARHELQILRQQVQQAEIQQQQASAQQLTRDQQAAAQLKSTMKQLEQVGADAAQQHEADRREMAKLADVMKDMDTKRAAAGGTDSPAAGISSAAQQRADIETAQGSYCSRA